LAAKTGSGISCCFGVNSGVCLAEADSQLCYLNAGQMRAIANTEKNELSGFMAKTTKGADA
jgi:hypothetical protein